MTKISTCYVARSRGRARCGDGTLSARESSSAAGLWTRAGVQCAVVGLLLIPEWASASAIESPRSLALAYIDPGTGSFLVQALVAAVAGIAVTSRAYWGKIRVFFGGTASSEGSAEDETIDE